MMKRFFAILLIVALLCTLGGFFVSCGNDNRETESTDTTGDISDTSENTDAVESGLAEISVEDLADFVIIRSDEEEYALWGAARILKAAILEKYSLDLELKSDFVNDKFDAYKEAEFEIIVGPCNRNESEEFLSALRYNDYGYTTVGKKLVIAGNSNASTLEAVNHFIANVLDKNDGAAFFDKDKNSYTFNQEYASYSLGGNPIEEYTVVYPASGKLGESSIAQLLAHTIAELTGYMPEVKRDTASSGEKEIRVGVTSRDTAPTLSEGEFFVGNSGNNVLIAANDAAGLFGAFNSFYEQLKATPALTLTESVHSPSAGDEITLLDFNVWMHTAGQDARVQSVLATIDMISPDIMGLQECTHDWMAILTDKYSAEYGIIGEGRDGTLTANDQFNPILYRKDKYNLIDSGTRWLSETPEVKYTKVPDSMYERIFTFAVLEEKSTGERFVVVNTHFDHVGGQGDQASVFAAYLSRFYEMPMFMTGDYNSTAMASNLLKAGYINSKIVAAEKVNPGQTYHSETGSGNEIDYIFTNGKGITVDHYEVMTAVVNGMYPSDHYPVFIKFKFLK